MLMRPRIFRHVQHRPHLRSGHIPAGPLHIRPDAGVAQYNLPFASAAPMWARRPLPTPTTNHATPPSGEPSTPGDRRARLLPVDHINRKRGAHRLLRLAEMGVGCGYAGFFVAVGRRG